MRKVGIFLISSFIFIFLCAVSFVCAEESISIVTYYPSPYGSYNDLTVANTLGIGNFSGSPGAKLQINVADTTTYSPANVVTNKNGIIIRNTSAGLGTSNYYSGIFFSQGHAAGSEPGNVNSAIVNVHTNPSSNKSDLAFMSYNDSGTPTENMRIKNNGNIGIGTTSPAYKIEVADTSSGWSSRIRNDYGGVPRSYIYMGHGGGYGMHIRGLTTGGEYTLQLYNANAETNRFANDGTVLLGLQGNVGIGTTSPNNSKGTGYLDVKDVYLRDIDKWASQYRVGDMVGCYYVGASGGTLPNPPCVTYNPTTCSSGWVATSCHGDTGMDCCIKVN